MNKERNSVETFLQKDRRLKARKQSYKETYRKGALVEYNGKDKLVEWINQDDIIIRLHTAGKMDDGTEFIQVTIEGFKP